MSGAVCYAKSGGAEMGERTASWANGVIVSGMKYAQQVKGSP